MSIPVFLLLTESQSSVDHSVGVLLVLHHSAQIFEVPLAQVALVRPFRNVVAGSGPSVLKLGLGGQHVPGLLVPCDEVVNSVPCSLPSWTVWASACLHVLHSICLRPESLHFTKGASVDLGPVHLLVLFHAVLVGSLVVGGVEHSIAGWAGSRDIVVVVGHSLL